MRTTPLGVRLWVENRESRHHEPGAHPEMMKIYRRLPDHEGTLNEEPANPGRETRSSWVWRGKPCGRRWLRSLLSELEGTWPWVPGCGDPHHLETAPIPNPSAFFHRLRLASSAAKRASQRSSAGLETPLTDTPPPVICTSSSGVTTPYSLSPIRRCPSTTSRTSPSMRTSGPS